MRRQFHSVSEVFQHSRIVQAECTVLFHKPLRSQDSLLAQLATTFTTDGSRLTRVAGVTVAI
jgi:hypothetical protein